MNMYEYFPDIESDRSLSAKEIKQFIINNILPAAIHFWGEDYDDLDSVQNHEDVYRVISHPDGEHKIALGFELNHLYPLDDYDEPDRSKPCDPYISVSLQALRPDLTERLHRQYRDGFEIWEVSTYDFSLDVLSTEETPIANRFYEVKLNDEDASPVPMRVERFIKKITKQPATDPDRDIELSVQDAIDIHNVLLALEVPEGVISLAS